MTAPATVHVVCPLCGADDAEQRYRATGHGGGAGAYRCTSPGLGRHGPIVRCRRCGQVYTDPQPAPADLLAAYREVEDPSYLAQRVGREHTFRMLLGELHEIVSPPGRLLDVGCYTGVFAAAAAAAGWQVTGLELSRWAAAVARRDTGLAIHECTLDELPVAPGSLDVVTLWDVIEHLSAPRASLGRVAALLRPGGVLGLSTHFLDTAAARLLGSRYPFLMDMHLSHFTVATLMRMLEASGFEVVGVRRYRRHVTLGYLFDRISNLNLPLARLARRLAAVGGGRLVAVRGVGLRNVWARRVMTASAASDSR